MNEQLPRSFLELCLLVCTAAVAAVAFTHHPTPTALALVATFAAVGFRVLPSLNRVLTRIHPQPDGSPEPRADPHGSRRRPPIGARIEHGGVSDQVRSVIVERLTVRVDGRAAPLLASVDLQLHPGEIVGILGASGAGKTSLVNPPRIHPRDSGPILVNGDVDVDRTRFVGVAPRSSPKTWSSSTHRSARTSASVMILTKSTMTASVEALTLGASRRDRGRAPDGLGTALGESGARLSGGQRQRFGVARALFYNTDVLVLDESTAGLDHATEQRLLGTLLELRQDRIVLFVSHHRSVMEDCDRLVMLDAVVSWHRLSR